MKVQWSSEDLMLLEQCIPKQGIRKTALRTNHSVRETYEQAIATGVHTPPNGTGPWPRRTSRGAAWPAADERILRQEYTGPASISKISDLLDRSPHDVRAMSITLGLSTSAPPHRAQPKHQRSELAVTPLPMWPGTPPARQVIAPGQSSHTGRTARQPADRSPGQTGHRAQAEAIACFENAASGFEHLASALYVAPAKELLQGEHSPSGRGEWTAAEEDYLRAHYHMLPALEIATAIGKTYYQTTSRARRLNLATPLKTWARWETIFLLERLQTVPLPSVAKAIGRSMSSVSLRPKQLGIFPGWTKEYDQVLLAQKNKLTHSEIGSLISRPAYAVRNRIRFLTDHDFDFSKSGIARVFASKGKKWIDGLIYLPVRPAEIGKHKWTQAELSFLKEHYLSKGSLWCAEQLNINAERIRRKAQVLGVKRRKANRPWTKKEERWLLKNVLLLDRMECAEHLNRTKGAVSVRASKLGAFSNSVNLA